MAAPPGSSTIWIFASRLASSPPSHGEEGGLPGGILAQRSEATVRQLLSRFTGLAPERVPLVRGRWGKPLLPESFGLWFNLSHSGDQCLTAIARFPVGIDLESDRPRKDPVGLARRFLLPEEAAAVAAAPPQAQSKAFLRIWTKKEAFLKGCGIGLFRSPRSFRFVRRAGSPWESVDPPETDGLPWAVRSAACHGDFISALAISHPEPESLVLRIETISTGGRVPGGDGTQALSVDERD